MIDRDVVLVLAGMAAGVAASLLTGLATGLAVRVALGPHGRSALPGGLAPEGEPAPAGADSAAAEGPEREIAAALAVIAARAAARG